MPSVHTADRQIGTDRLLEILFSLLRFKAAINCLGKCLFKYHKDPRVSSFLCKLFVLFSCLQYIIIWKSQFKSCFYLGNECDNTQRGKQKSHNDNCVTVRNLSGETPKQQETQ